MSILRQSHKLGAFWGNLKLVAQHGNIYVQFMILGFSSISAYDALSGWLIEKGIQLMFWQFVLAIVICLCVLAFFSWRFDIPSSFISWNIQWWNHRNPLREEMRDVKKDLALIKSKLGIKDDEPK